MPKVITIICHLPFLSKSMTDPFARRNRIFSCQFVDSDYIEDLRNRKGHYHRDPLREQFTEYSYSFDIR